MATPTYARPTAPRPTATFVPLVTPSPTPYVLRLSVDETLERVEAGEAILVDLQPPSVYKDGHIAGAISLPAYELVERHSELPNDQLVIFYCACANESQSVRAALTAMGVGVPHAAVLRGGWWAWLRAGFPAERSPTATPAPMPTRTPGYR
jgi:rhodanese-related sulfurtransferase